ncbi:unnamed protein product [Chrysodeixis includens]|uniref:Uncharacterized protein n=1 Tax=Chrysodeixis includens TaxID=689277 RepID=A0A9N8KYR0_CHRIL|nr:unnamed protein product [Chrysodeixis includens]
MVLLGALEGGALGGGGGGGALGALRAAGSPPAPSLGASRHSLIGFQVVCPEEIDELCSARSERRHAASDARGEAGRREGGGEGGGGASWCQRVGGYS